MNQAVAKTALTGCLAPIDKKGLDELIAKGKADPKVVKTLKCRTVAEGRFRHLNFIRRRRLTGRRRSGGRLGRSDRHGWIRW